MSAAAAGVDLRATHTVSVFAASRDPQRESAEHMEKLRAAALGALKRTAMRVVHRKEDSQWVLEVVTVPKEGRGGPAATVVLRERASGRPLYCSSERGMAEHNAADQLLTQFNMVLRGELPAPSSNAMNACVASEGL